MCHTKTSSSIRRTQKSYSPPEPQMLSFQKSSLEALVSYFYFQMASVPVKTSIGCMEFGRQCSSDQVWCAIVTIVINL